MKRNLLAIAIPALLVASAANAVELYNKDGNKLNVYGRVKAMNYTSVGNSSDLIKEDGDNSSGRLGFLGETQITEALIGYGRAEWERGISSGNSFETRYAYAGFSFADYGSIDYGKNDGVLKSITNYTDVLPEFGGDGATYNAYLLSTRSEAVLTYHNDDFFGLVDGLKFGLQYQDQGSRTPELVGTTSTNSNNAEAFGTTLEYNILDSGLTIGGGYARSLGDTTYTFDGTDYNGKMTTWNAGLKYDADNLYIAALYAHSKVGDVKFNDFEIVGQYGFDFEIGRLTPSVAYVQSKVKRDGGSADVYKYVDLGAIYDFNKHMSAIVDYKFNLIDDQRDALALGVIYRF